jgi:hypothetical protein
MIAFAKRWLSFDERTFGLLLAAGLLTMAFFRLDELRRDLGVAPGTDLPLFLVAAALAWWTMLPRGFVWLEPAVLTWRDYAGGRERMISGRLVSGWVGRQLAVGYVLALLAALAAVPVSWTRACVAVVVAAGLLALGALRRPRGRGETAVVLLVAALAVGARPGPVLLWILAAVLVVAAVPLLARSGSPGHPRIASADRLRLVEGWRDRVLRTSGLQFLDLALLLPAARPLEPRAFRPFSLRGATGLRFAWLGVLGRRRHFPTAGLLALTAAAVHRTLPGLPDDVVFGLLGYLAVVPLAAGLGELWRSPGRRRWVGRSDLALRAVHLVVLTGVAAVWAAVTTALAGYDPSVLLTVPLLAACAVRTVTRPPPTYDNLAPVDTPVGTIPVRLLLQTVRGPDVGALALAGLALPGGAAGIALVPFVVAFCVLR